MGAAVVRSGGMVTPDAATPPDITVPNAAMPTNRTTPDVATPPDVTVSDMATSPVISIAGLHTQTLKRLLLAGKGHPEVWRLPCYSANGSGCHHHGTAIRGAGLQMGPSETCVMGGLIPFLHSMETLCAAGWRE